jgi:hypothetical protein
MPCSGRLQIFLDLRLSMAFDAPSCAFTLLLSRDGIDQQDRRCLDDY